MLTGICAIQHRTLAKSRRYVFVVNLVICSLITPDFITAFFVLIPLTILFEICIQISAYLERQRKA
jgi:Sec-independent protein secretion pathway component TatC